jgi:SRSO17 transposase
MDAAEILQIKPSLTQFLRRFDPDLGRVSNRRYLDMYVGGQLGPLPRKSVEPIADAAQEPPRNLQQFLSLLKWDESAVRDRLQRQVARDHADPNSVGVVDETTFLKKGKKTAGVQHQYCGTVGKQANCMMSVHLGYATPGGFHCMLDGEVYLPEKTWHEDRERCREAGVPDDYVYRPKWKMALEQLERANANGVRLAWLTFDEAYGDNGDFRRALEARGQNYVGEVPSDFAVWTKPPAALHREHARDRAGEPGQKRRLKIKNNPRAKVRDLVEHSPILRQEPWVRHRVKDGSKGPAVWEAKRVMVYLPDDKGLPGAPSHLLVARNVLTGEVKYFISNAPPETAVETLLLVAFSRWHVERLFQDTKTELGMAHLEARLFKAVQRHLILSCVSYLFLAAHHQGQDKKKYGPDDLATAGCDSPARAHLVEWGPLFAGAGRNDRQENPADSETQRQERNLGNQEDDQAASRLGHHAGRAQKLPVAEVVAL